METIFNEQPPQSATTPSLYVDLIIKLLYMMGYLTVQDVIW